MYMFNGKTNDGFYDMGLAVVKGIGERVEEEGVVRGGKMAFDGEGEDEGQPGEGGGLEVEKVEKREEGTIPGLEGEKGVWDR